jgi:hypothetical protein
MIIHVLFQEISQSTVIILLCVIVYKLSMHIGNLLAGNHCNTL